MQLPWRMRYYPAVGPAIPHESVGRSRVTHPFAGHHCWCPRLACVKHAASVRPEPGSNSPIEFAYSSEIRCPRCSRKQRVRITKNVRFDSPRSPEKDRINKSPRTSPISISIVNQRQLCVTAAKRQEPLTISWLALRGKAHDIVKFIYLLRGTNPNCVPRTPSLHACPYPCAR
jgi:hypothetical protein